MSKKRQHHPDADVLIRNYAVTHPPGSVFAWRSMDWGQLAYASHGVMTVHTRQGTWVVPPHRAVWIPCGMGHSMEMAGPVSVRSLYVTRALCAALPDRCVAINVSPLLRELVIDASLRGPLRRTRPAEARLARVIVDQLHVSPLVPLQLPLPQDPRARRAVEHWHAHVADGRDTAAVARLCGASKRTLERIFVRETGMTAGRWRQRQRLMEAMRRLAAGQDVTSVAMDVGYASVSAFVYAFRTQFGATPARYFKAEPPPPV